MAQVRFMNEEVMKVEETGQDSTDTLISPSGDEGSTPSDQKSVHDERSGFTSQTLQDKITLLQLDFNAQIGELQEQYEEKVADLAKQRDEYLDQLRRRVAEFQNFKKRSERQRIERERQSNAKLLKQLLPILDDLQRAAQYVPVEIRGNDWVNGMLAIERKLWNVLEQSGLSVIEIEPGQPFDPNIHDALLSIDHDEFEPGQIIQELQRGYRHSEFVMRPARVSVAR